MADEETEEIEIAESGNRIIRHKARERDFQFATGDSEAIQAISDHITRHIGPVQTVFHEIISDLVHIDIHVVAPTPERNFYTLVTSGMSELPMQAPKGAEGWRYAELMICLPPTWPVTQEAFQLHEHYWPILWMKRLARLPHEYNSWLSMLHTIPNGDPAQPFASNTKLSCMMLSVPLLASPEFFALKVTEEKTIRFFSLIPLYAEETEFKLKHGGEALMDRLAKNNIAELLDTRRANVCQKKFLWFGRG